MLGPPLNCGQHLCSILQGVLTKRHQAFDRFMVGSQGAGDVLGMNLDLTLGLHSHLFDSSSLEGAGCAGAPTTSGLLIAV